MSIWDEDPKPKSKPRWVGITVAFIVFLGLVAGAVAAGEYLARDAAAGLVASPVSTALGAADEAEVEVHFGEGFLLGQLVTGSVDEVHATAEPVTVAGAVAKVVILATGVPISAPVVAKSFQADISIDQDGLGGFAATLVGDPAATMAIVGETLVLTTTGVAGGQPVPATLTLVPSVAEDGQLVLSVVAVTLNGADAPVDALAAGAYGPEAAGLTTPRTLCVAEFLPAGLALKTAVVTDGALAMRLSGTEVSLSGSAKGTCAAPAA